MIALRHMRKSPRKVRVLINEFDMSFRFKTGEKQAPFVELDIVEPGHGDNNDSVISLSGRSHAEPWSTA